ncbi:MAG TPA: hypothetical protein VGQ53_22825 [Chitinophagaceae bacterium]|nr:hypothetical protein [Chitinophagaceae bacterium]
MKKHLFNALSLVAFSLLASAQENDPGSGLLVFDHLLGTNSASKRVQPLQQLTIVNPKGVLIKVIDAKGKEYFSSPVRTIVGFRAGGALGKQHVFVYDHNKIIDSLDFVLDAFTNIDDGGYYKKMFDLFHNGMFADVKEGTFAVDWNGKTYHVFVPWVLDNFHTMKGLKYFLPNGRELVDIMRQSQREDGMIYSFIQHMPNVDYFLTRDKFSGYSKKIGDKVFVRQPVENHPEYIYVNTIYDSWKTDDDSEWMKKNLPSAAKALDYALNDPARWSKRFQLLKRVYTIDSWDFAVEDEYMPDLGLTNTMIIDPARSKFGVFFGDNTGYITACYQLHDMFEEAGDAKNALKYKKRGDEIKDRLNELAWNGKFFTHFVDEDSTVQRHLGVDERSQVAQSNAYSLNRDISHSQSKAIIQTYLNLKDHLPTGSPGEWYSIYPPFQKGYERHNEIWQYMNGGVGGHVAGELARGAYENGYENYGSDILTRLFELGKKYDNKIWFAYTGAMFPPPAPPVYKPLDLSGYANMDLSSSGSTSSLNWMNSKRAGDDLHNLPTGLQHFGDITFDVIDPIKNNRRAVVAVSKHKNFPSTVEISVNDTARCIYLLHTSSKPVSENIVGGIKIMYEDGSTKLQYILMDKQLTYWWFSQLKTDYSGVAWYGKNDVSEGVGVSWCAIDNPEPTKKINKLILLSPEGDGIYAVLGISLSNKEHYVPVKPTSYGGPDDWAAATAMAALVEGLAGVKDKAQAYKLPVIAPKWVTTKADSVNVTVRYAASQGYVSYQYLHHEKEKTISIIATGSGDKLFFHVLLPQNAKAKAVSCNKKIISLTQSTMERSNYADFETGNDKINLIELKYE